jgi:hypothetical protein
MSTVFDEMTKSLPFLSMRCRGVDDEGMVRAHEHCVGGFRGW